MSGKGKGVTPEQSCIMCHLSSGCPGCCAKCRSKCGTSQTCGLPFAEHDAERWKSWMHLLATNEEMAHLRAFVPSEYLPGPPGK